MLKARRFSSLALCLVAISFSTALGAQRPANANSFYQQLRGLLPGGEVIAVKDTVIKRDAATFTLKSGNIAFFGQVNGKVTGAVFKGDGHIHLKPPTAEERHSLQIATHSEEYDEDFDEVVFRFTDSTADELHKASAGAGQASSAYTRAAQDVQSFLRHHAEGSYVGGGYTFYYKKLYGNLDLRLLEDVMSPAPGRYFFAAIHGGNNGHLYFIYDPHGVADVAPEEVALIKWNATDETEIIPLAFHRAEEYASGTPSGNEHNAAFKIQHEDLDVTIEKSGFLGDLATIQVLAEQDGVAVVPLNLYAGLRVSQVTTAKGDALDWVQEAKEEDPNFGVVLATPLKKGETATFKVTYGAKGVVLNEGGNNYYPTQREDWYPSSDQGLGDYATYHMFFHIPRELQIIATGTKVKESTDGKITTSEWKSETPISVVGFSIGEFTMKETKIGTPLSGELTIDAFANSDRPDQIRDLVRVLGDHNISFGTLETTPMLANEIRQGEVAAALYTDYFGPLPFSHIALTQQTACNYGQSWPMLVYLPICGFFDKTQRHYLLGSSWFDDTYWDVVTPHEVAHQWWGHTVGFRGYRDQWMSEGFADESATIYLQATNQSDLFNEFWKQQRKMLVEKNAFGFRPIDVGPVTMGTRLSSHNAGWSVYRELVYPKGAYILHMIRMMMWSAKDGDTRFKQTMHDLLATYNLQAATTEDFKAIVEKHMSPQMDLDNNHKMDWYFNEYVYGTQLPVYHFESQLTPNDKGTLLHIKLTQSGVPDSFKMPVPLYLEMSDGKVVRAGSLVVTGSKSVEQTAQLPKFPTPVKRALINYYYDVLSTEN